MIENPWKNLKRPPLLSRRSMLRDTACGFGVLGLAGLLSEADRLAAASAAANPLAVRKPHFEPRAKQVIFLFMHGGPSSVDILDPKPRLYRDHGKPLPIKRPLAFDEDPPGPLMKPLWDFKRTGRSGIPMSDLFPHVRTCVDDLCVIRSMVGEGRGPRSRAAADLHRHQHLHAPVARVLGPVRPGHGEPEPARLHHHQAGVGPRRRQELELRLPARSLPGHRHRPLGAQGQGLSGRAHRVPGPPRLHAGAAALRAGHAPEHSIGAMLNFDSTMPSWRPASRPSNWRFECR